MPRYTADREFPTYSYVPGKFPHPIGDPQGHSYGLELPKSPPLTPERWRGNHSYLWGIDLFNHGYYWEAHEAWETAWIGTGRSGSVADFLKALIKIAAAGVKAREGREVGVRRHSMRCVELIRCIETPGERCMLGLDTVDLRTAAAYVADHASSITVEAQADMTTHSLPVNMVLSS